MKAFAYVRAADVDDGPSSDHPEPRAKFLGGGTNLVDLMREGIERPETVIDISRLPLDDIEELPDGRLRIGALVRNSRLAAHPLIRTRYPMLSQAILTALPGSCGTWRRSAGTCCSVPAACTSTMRRRRATSASRAPGAPRMEGFNRGNAVLGTSDHCVATHPSDMAVALAALDATVEVKSARGMRNIALTDFHRLPGATPHLETELDADELITAVELPAACGRGQLPLPQGARPSLVRLRTGLGRRGDGGRRGRHDRRGPAGARRRRRRNRGAHTRRSGSCSGRRPPRRRSVGPRRPNSPPPTGLPGNTFKIDLARRTIVAVLRQLLKDGSAA